MSETKHTPGPWRVGARGSVVSDTLAEGALSGSEDRKYYDGFLIAESIAPCNRPFIAAAPEMFELLSTIENDDNKIPEWLWTKIRAVVAKARGEQ